MSEIVKEKMMTTKEVAEVLGVDIKTIQRVASEIFNLSTVLSESTGGRPTMAFTESQVTAIKIELQNHSKIAQNTLTTKELANELRVSDETIRNTAKVLFDPSKVLWRVINGGKTMIFNEEQATAIKVKLRERNNLKDSSVVKQIGNDLEFLALLKQQADRQKELDAYRDAKIAELQQRIEHAETKLVEQQPKVDYYDAIISSGDAIDMGVVSKTLAIKGLGRNNLFEFLREHGILDKNNIPYQRFVDAGYFKTVECKYTVGDDTRIAIKTVVFQKGVEFIRDLVKGAKDE